jgi:hypothetical protein
MIIFFQIFPNGPPMEFLFTLWYPKGSARKTGQGVTLAKVSL